MRLNSYLEKATVYEIETASRNLCFPMKKLSGNHRANMASVLHELVEPHRQQPSPFREQVEGGENIFLRLRPDCIVFRVKPFSDETRLSIYNACFPFFAARIHLPEQSGSRLAITKQIAVKMTGFTARSVKADLAKYRKAWPVKRELIKLCIAQEKAAAMLDGKSPLFWLPPETVPGYVMEPREWGERTVKLLVTYLAALTFTTAASTALTHDDGQLGNMYLGDLRKEMAKVLESIKSVSQLKATEDISMSSCVNGKKTLSQRNANELRQHRLQLETELAALDEQIKKTNHDKR